MYSGEGAAFWPPRFPYKTGGRFYGISLEKFIGKIPANYVYDDEFIESQPEAHYMAQLSKEETDLIINLRLSNDDAKREIFDLARAKTNRKSI